MLSNYNIQGCCSFVWQNDVVKNAVKIQQKIVTLLFVGNKYK